jgi:cation:H+ antiporter
LALTVLIHPMPVAENTIKRSWPVMFLSGIILYLFMLDNKLGHFEGMLMFGLLMLFIVRSIKSNRSFVPVEEKMVPKQKFTKKVYLLMVVTASVGLAIGSRFLVQGASGIASGLGVSERVISLTVVAFGTSIPELTTSIVAALRKEANISVGNIIGSNVFNVYAVIGITSTFQNIRFRFTDFQIDMAFMLLFYLILFLAFLPLRSGWENRRSLSEWYSNVKTGKVGRISGFIMILLYASYLVLILKIKPQ